MSLLKLKVGSAGGVPPAAYQAKFLSVEVADANPLKGYQAGLRWTFEVVAGEHTGKKAYRTTTGLEPKPGTAGGAILAGLLGRQLAINEEVDLTGVVGKTFFIFVGPAKEGDGTRIESVASLPPDAAQAQLPV